VVTLTFFAASVGLSVLAIVASRAPERVRRRPPPDPDPASRPMPRSTRRTATRVHVQPGSNPTWLTIPQLAPTPRHDLGAVGTDSRACIRASTRSCGGGGHPDRTLRGLVWKWKGDFCQPGANGCCRTRSRGGLPGHQPQRQGAVAINNIAGSALTNPPSCSRSSIPISKTTCVSPRCSRRVPWPESALTIRQFTRRYSLEDLLTVGAVTPAVATQLHCGYRGTAQHPHRSRNRHGTRRRRERQGRRIK
jgi:hypothetical protein